MHEPKTPIKSRIKVFFFGFKLKLIYKISPELHIIISIWRLYSENIKKGKKFGINSNYSYF